MLKSLGNEGGAALPDQTGQAGKALFTDGTNPSWEIPVVMPAGGNTAVQYNNNGVLGGDEAIFALNGSTLTLVGQFNAAGFGAIFLPGAGTAANPAIELESSGNGFYSALTGMRVTMGGVPVLEWSSGSMDLAQFGSTLFVNFVDTLGDALFINGLEGTSGQVLQSMGPGLPPEWVTPSAGTPAGSNTQIQYNNSGAFGASADFTWNNTTKVLTLGPDGGDLAYIVGGANGSNPTSLIIRGGPATSGNAGGSVTVQGGSSSDGAGGDVTVRGSDGVGTNRPGGALLVTAGNSTGVINGADLTLSGGSSVSGAVGKVITSTKLQVGSGVVPTGSGFKHARVTTGSVTAGSSALVTVTWGTAFADANYTVSASVVDSTASTLSLQVQHVEVVSASEVQVRVANTAVSDLTGTLHVIAIHD